MRSRGVEVVPPGSDHRTGMTHREEQVLIYAFVSHPALEAFGHGVLAHGVVSAGRSGAVLLPRLGIAPGWNDGMGLTLRDGTVAAVRVVGAVRP